MSETISNDYVSMINKRGSGYNIPVIVDAIVDAAIAPAKEIVTAKKEKVDALISGMATLKSSAKISETTIKGLSSSGHHAVSQSPDSKFMQTTIADATKVTASSHTMSHIVLAKPMVYRLDNAGAASSSTVNQTITIEFGTNDSTNSFTASSPARSHDVVLSGKSLAGLVQELNNVAGIKVELVQLNSNSTNTSVIFTSETGSTNGFKISSTVSNSRWQTSSSGGGTITQVSNDAAFKLNGQDFVRSSNTVTDIIPGLQVKLLANTAAVQSINVTKSTTEIQKTVEDLVAELNAYKADINTLGFVDEVGDEDGDLAQSSFLRGAKQKFMNFMTSPITGYGDADIYFVEFGIKTAIDGSYTFDKTTFDRTFRNTPDKFSALTQDKSYASDPSVYVFSTATSKVPQGKHTFADTGNKLSHSATNSEKTLTSAAAGTKFSFSTADYPGFLFQADSNTPGDFDIYVGRSAKTKLSNFFAEAQATSSIHNTVVTLYQERSDNLKLRLDKIDQRELLLQSQYTKQFSAMEKTVTSSTTSAEYLTQLVDGWNKSY